jgi:DNA polymerase-3 subunit delta
MKSCWLVTGDDPTLIDEAARGKIGELSEGDPMAVEDYGGDEVDLSAVADSCRTPPFLASRRVVVVRDVGRFSADEVAPLVDYLAEPLETTTLVLVGGAGKPPTRLLDAAKKAGGLVETRVESRDAKGWVRERAANAGVRLDAAAEALLISHLGEDLSRLLGLLEVVRAVYGEGAKVGIEQLEPYLGDAGAVAPWELTDAIDAGDTASALAVLHRMLGAGDRHPLVVLAGLHRHVSAMMRLDAPGITTEAAAAAALGIAKGRSTFPAKKALNQLRRVGPSAVAEMSGLVADAELALKGASALPPELVLEVLVARLCRLARVSKGSGRAAARAAPPAKSRARSPRPGPAS